jgi:hypothetical protein
MIDELVKNAANQITNQGETGPPANIRPTQRPAGNASEQKSGMIGGQVTLYA